MQRDRPKFAVSRIFVYSLINIVIQLDDDYVSVVVYSVIVESKHNVMSTLLPHVESCISHLTDTMCLPWRGYVFELWLSDIAIGSFSTMLLLSYCILS